MSIDPEIEKSAKELLDRSQEWLRKTLQESGLSQVEVDEAMNVANGVAYGIFSAGKELIRHEP